MIDNTSMLIYYITKRIFLFIDEWLFYLTLFMIYRNKWYKLLPIVILYGISCIYTSYSNIDKIERLIADVPQSIFLFDTPLLMLIENGVKWIYDYYV